MNALQKLGFAALTVVPSFAFAAVDVTDLTTEISGAAAPIATVALAVLVILAGVKVFKLIRRAM